MLWRWEGDAFGTSSPQLATVKMPLRMAGQYADDETGLFYNYFRFYDPKTGRYVENDPIGLQGGMNRWAYVSGNPLKFNDPKGLMKKICESCENIFPVIRQALEERFPYYKGISCTVKCGSLLLGGQAATQFGTITLNYTKISELNLLDIASAFAHELRHCKEGRFSLSYWGSADLGSYFYNPAHEALDSESYNDAYQILGTIRERAKECSECQP